MSRQILLPLLAGCCLCVMTAPLSAAPSAGSAMDLARWASVRTWTGPMVKYTGVEIQPPTEVVAKRSVWNVTAAPGESPVNFGLEWDEPRSPRTITVTYADAASMPLPDGHELQVWLHPERILEGGESPWQGHWRALSGVKGFSASSSGLTWTYNLPRIDEGIYKFRVVLKGKTAARIRSISATGDAKWRRTEFEVRFDPPRDTARNSVEGHNAIVTGIAPIRGCDGFRVEALASNASSGSTDRGIFTVRAGSRSFSFLPNDLDIDGRIVVKALGAVVTRPGANPARAAEKTITDRVLEMSEQTYDGALKGVPPKKRNKFLSLSPPLNPRKFAVKPSGDIFSRDEWDLNYQVATGDDPDFRRIEPQRIEDDCLPVLYADWEDGGLCWRQDYVVTALGGRFDDPTAETVMVTRVSAKNEGSAPVVAKLWLCLRGGEDRCVDARLDNGVVFEDKCVRAIVESQGWDVPERSGRLLFTTAVPPGETRSVELEIPFAQNENVPPRTGFDAARKQTIDYWNARLASGADFAVPDERVNSIWKSLLIHQYCWGDYDERTGVCMPNVAAFTYGPVGNESSQMCKALDFFGHDRIARDYYEDMWKKQGAEHLQALATNGDGCLPGWWGSYIFNTGFHLWNLGNHYRLTGDRAWLDQVVPTMIKACDWLAEQRRTTIARDRGGQPLMESGLFPPCGLEDEGRLFYWVMTNGYFYLGMSSTADLLGQIGHPDAGRIADEAKAYLKDLRRGIGESIVRCPVMRLRDGSYVPYVPKHLYVRGRSEGFYEAELGALHLLTTNVYAPDSLEMDWTLAFLEDRVFMTEAPSRDSIVSFKDIERDWFHLGGYGKTQPYLLHTQIAYLRRDQPKLFLRSFWNQLVAQNFSDINAFPEHICWSGAADCKTYEEAMWLQQFRSMLVFDEDGVLRLCASAPREWLEDGKVISVKNAPTFFGSVSFDIRSEAANGRISARVDFSPRKAPGKLILRLRHPRELRMRTVTVNGKPWSRFDAAKEIIELPASGGPVTVVAGY